MIYIAALMNIQGLRQSFEYYFNAESKIMVHAPGRVTLVGEHTDYNGALELIVDCVGEQKSCHGTRMTDAGFGGCAVALVKEQNARVFINAVSAAYRPRSGLEANI